MELQDFHIHEARKRVREEMAGKIASMTDAQKFSEHGRVLRTCYRDINELETERKILEEKLHICNQHLQACYEGGIHAARHIV